VRTHEPGRLFGRANGGGVKLAAHSGLAVVQRRPAGAPVAETQHQTRASSGTASIAVSKSVSQSIYRLNSSDLRPTLI
jgi:hypothetical protein